jgi:DNA-binding CsgD family transcriptional regulator
MNAPEPEVVAAENELSAVIGADSEQRWSRVADFGQAARTALRRGDATECLAALDRQRAAAEDDEHALVWALTSSCSCRAILGHLHQARSDLAQAREAVLPTITARAPVLADPFWKLTEVLCDWLAGNWAAAVEATAGFDASRVLPVAPALGETITAIRLELLRGLGRTAECRALAHQLAAAPPAEMTAWALGGVDVDQGQPGAAMRRLSEVCDLGERAANRAALPLALHRMAEAAFACGDRGVTALAAATLAGLDQTAPLTAILTGLALAYASGDPAPARQAQSRAEAEGAAALAAEALTVRGRIGDEPAATLSAALSAWRQIGAIGRVGTVREAMRSAGLPVPAGDPDGNGRPATGPVSGQGTVLTERERAMARLVHEGRTNKQIARALHISVKTVEASLTRVYRKTSCTSRVGLAVAVTQHRVRVGDEPIDGQNQRS